MHQIPFLKGVIPAFLVIISSLLAAWLIVQYGLDFRYLLFFVMLIAVLAILVTGKRGLKIGFVIWIGMFLLGYRTIYLTSYFRLHPLIVFLSLLFVILLFALKSEGNTKLKLPSILWLFSIFWIWGFVIGAARGRSFANMTSEALNFFYLIPLFMIILYLSKSPDFWRSISMIFLATGTMICFLGTIEFYFPAYLRLIPGLLQTNVEGLGSFSGFTRASFAFWGATPAVIVSALSLPMIWLVPDFYKGWRGKFLMIIVAVVLLLGIYLSGTRAAWLMVFVASIIFSYFAFKILGVLISAGFWFVVSRFFSAEVWNLIFSLYTPLASGQILDSSIQKRVLRQQDAFQLAIDNPWGVGWTGSGWVHGDFMQVAANLGLLAGILFLAWYVITIYRACLVYRKYPRDKVIQALLVSFVLCGIVLATEGAQVLAQYIMPVWFAWGLMEAYLQQKTVKAETE